MSLSLPLAVANGNGLGRKSEMTLSILGCGALGTAILSGILASLSESESHSAYPSQSGSATPSESVAVTPTKFIACVQRPESAKRVENVVKAYPIPVNIIQKNSLRGVQEADVIILGCKPYMVKDILDVPGMREALAGKLLISILAGVPVAQIEGVLYPEGSTIPTQSRCRIVQTMPNTAAMVREGMTTIAHSTPPLPAEWDSLVTWIFTRIGRVVRVAPGLMDVSAALAGSGPAFVALMLESLIDGGVAMGMTRTDASLVATQMMRGTTAMVQSGEHPAIIREKVSSPGGCTIGGLLVLEEGAVRGSIARAVREATVVASQLGQGVKNVNGTRH